MPIKPENKKLYPPNWDQISYDIRTNRAKGRCEVCGVKNHSIIKRNPDGTFRYINSVDWDMINARIKWNSSNLSESLRYHGFVRVVLTVAHLDHNPANCDYNNLKAMCQRCHNRYDRHHRNQTRRKSKLKGQLTINF
jgi:hypothetical protein